MFTLKNKIIITLFFTLFASQVIAANGNNVSQVSFVVQNNDLSVDINDSVNVVSVTKVKATWWQPLTKSLEGGVSLGYAELDQDEYTGVQSYATNGYTIGFALRAGLINANAIQLGLNFNFDYLQTSGYTSSTGSSIDQRTEVNWFEYGAGIVLVLLPKSTVSILGGASDTELDGDLKVDNSNGNGSTRRSFAVHTPEGYYGGIRINTGQTGRIDMKWESGTRKGFYLAFSNRF